MNKKIAVVLISFLSVLPMVGMASDLIFTKEVEAEFTDVRIDIDNAIANGGFVVDFQADISEMLDRTAADVGSTSPVFLHAETWQFCSSILSRKMVEVNPINIAYCPYVVFAYEVVDKPGVVVVGYRLNHVDDGDSKAILAEIDGQLETIVNDVVE